MFRPWEDNIENPVLNVCNSNNENLEKKRKHVDVKDVLDYLKFNIYPGNISTKNEKSNFRKQCKPFQIEDGQLFYKKTHARVIFSADEQLRIIKMIHCGSDSSIEASALSAHRGRDTTQRLIKQRYFWNHMSDDVRDFIMRCDSCQRVNPTSLKVVPELRSVEIPKQVFNQIGVDIMTLPEVDGFKYVVVGIDYFSKWSEARPIKDKSAVTVARFLYDEIICRHGCPKVQISDQGREFVNNLNNELFRLTGTEQRVTSAYHPQANGLVERQNRTIKNCLLKVLQENVLQWPYILQGVLFAHRTAQHSSTGYTPFKMLYQRDATLPIDINYDDKNKSSEETNSNVYDSDHQDNDLDLFDQETFKSTLNQMIVMRNVMEEKAKKNIDEAQTRQRYSYSKRHNTGHIFQEGDKVFVRNLSRDDRKGGWRQIPWKGPYEIVSIHSGNTCVLKNEFKVLKKKIHLKNLKIYNEPKENKLEEKYDADKSGSKSSDTDHSKDIDDLQVKDNIEYTKSKLDESKKDKRVFNPVTKPWQLRQNKVLNLKIVKCLIYKYRGKILGEPTKIINIIGDGNCLYRSISYWITGTEDHHLKIRHLIAEVVKTNENIEKYVGGKNKLKKYLEKNIENDGVWGTDVEIFAAAFLLKTSIYVYSTDTNKWQIFNKYMDLKKMVKMNEKCLYIRNVNNVHYDVVIDV